MNNVTVLEDVIGADWVRRVRVMSASQSELDAYAARLPAHATKAQSKDELRIFRLVAEWPLRDVVNLRHPYFVEVTCPIAAWWIDNEKVSKLMVAVGEKFALEIGFDPQVAYMQKLPANAPEFVDVRGICLAQADWVPMGFLAVMRCGMWRGLPAFKVVK